MADSRGLDRGGEGAFSPVGPPDSDMPATDGRGHSDGAMGSGGRSWHASREDRLTIVEKIKLLISQRHARVTNQDLPDYAAKILDMARRCEAKLYLDATSLEEYKDQTSLVSRLKVVVTSMQQARRPTDARTPTAGGALTPSTSSLSLPAHAVTTPTNGATGGVETIRASPPAVSIPSSALAPPNGGVQNGSMAQHWGSSVPNTVGTAFSPVQPPPALPNMPQRPSMVRPVTPTAPPPAPAPSGNVMVSMAALNPLLAPSAPPEPEPKPLAVPIMSPPSVDAPVKAEIVGGATSAGFGGGESMKPDTGDAIKFENDVQLPTRADFENTDASEGGGPMNDMQGMQSAAMNPEQHKQFLKSQQQRLLLLRHASKCPALPGQCTATPFCGPMKQLWPHLAHCKNNPCHVRHCVSSRYVLSHYHRCKKQCDVCTPVRDAIRRNNERARQMAEQRAREMGLDPAAAGAQAGNTSPEVPSVDEEPKPGTKKRPQQRKKAGAGEDKPAAPARKRNKPNEAEAADEEAIEAPKPVISIPRGMVAAALADKEAAAKPPAEDVPAIEKFRTNDSLCARMRRREVQEHARSLLVDFNACHTTDSIRQLCKPLLDKLFELPFIDWYSTPVDKHKLGILDYDDIIKRRMDLGTVKKLLDGCQYTTMHDFYKDVMLVWDNATRYNARDNVVHQRAVDYKKRFYEMFTQVLQQWKRDVDIRKADPDNCSLCGGSQLEFEVPAIFCQVCSTRLKRGSNYYTNANRKYHWCASCYRGLKDPVSVEGKEFALSTIVKEKNQEAVAESWVECEGCNRWQHQICALFNQRRHEANSSRKYYCPMCLMKALDVPAPPPQPQLKGAALLEQTTLSQFIERRIQVLVDNYRKSESEILKVPLDKIAPVPRLTLRVVATTEKEFFVTPSMRDRYKAKGYPDSFFQRSKAIFLFQEVDGVDVILFGMYVQEYGSDCPPPNHRTAYLSYIDSIKYFRPPELRTQVYQEILVAYLEHLKRRGFLSMMLWGCPPQPGDDYVLYCHPPGQKTPKPDMLRKWYLQMFATGRKQRLVDRVDYLKDVFYPDNGKFGKGRFTALTELPYYEGDYWPGMIDQFLNTIESEGGEAAVLAAGGEDSSEDETVMSVSAPTPQPNAADVSMLGDSSDEDDVPPPPPPMESAQSDGTPASTTPIPAPPPSATNSVAAAKAKAKSKAKRKSTTRNERKNKVTGGTGGGGATNKPKNNQKKGFRAPKYNIFGEPIEPDALRDKVNEMLSAMRMDFILGRLCPSCALCRKYFTGLDGETVKYDCPRCCNHDEDNAYSLCQRCYGLLDTLPDSMRHEHPLMKTDVVPIAADSKDPDPLIDSQFFETRVKFLNLCQGNHYQFDSLRRAKHSSAMILYHAHNPSAPAFRHTCDNCNTDIMTGNRWECETCSEYDLCDECKVTVGHIHPLRSYPVVGAGEDDEDEGDVMARQQEERRRRQGIEMHMALLLHAATCRNDPSSKCQSTNCQKVKQMLEHSEKCPVRASGGCAECRKFWFLLQLHARSCRTMPPESCPVPRCKDLKDHYRRARQLEQQKQLRMDERRRNFAMAEMMQSRPGAPGVTPAIGGMPAASVTPQLLEMMKRQASEGTVAASGFPSVVPPGMSEEQRRMQIKLQQQRAAQRAALGASAAAVTPTNSAANPSSSASVSASALDPIQATIMCGLDPTTNMGACGNYSNAQALMTKANLTTESLGFDVATVRLQEVLTMFQSISQAKQEGKMTPLMQAQFKIVAELPVVRVWLSRRQRHGGSSTTSGSRQSSQTPAASGNGGEAAVDTPSALERSQSMLLSPLPSASDATGDAQRSEEVVAETPAPAAAIPMSHSGAGNQATPMPSPFAFGESEEGATGDGDAKPKTEDTPKDE